MTDDPRTFELLFELADHDRGSRSEETLAAIRGALHADPSVEAVHVDAPGTPRIEPVTTSLAAIYTARVVVRGLPKDVEAVAATIDAFRRLGAKLHLAPSVTIDRKQVDLDVADKAALAERAAADIRARQDW
jgi:hypothetical protein